MAACRDIGYVLDKLAWMRAEGIWPNGLRYLWTDAFGVVLLVSLHAELKDPQYLEQARALVADVERVLGRPRGLRIGEAPDRGGQYYHYLAMWMYALCRPRAARAGIHAKGINWHGTCTMLSSSRRMASGGKCART